jgi:hypothetical protein
MSDLDNQIPSENDNGSKFTFEETVAVYGGHIGDTYVNNQYSAAPVLEKSPKLRLSNESRPSEMGDMLRQLRQKRLIVLFAPPFWQVEYVVEHLAQQIQKDLHADEKNPAEYYTALSTVNLDVLEREIKSRKPVLRGVAHVPAMDIESGSPPDMNSLELSLKAAPEFHLILTTKQPWKEWDKTGLQPAQFVNL